MKHNNKKKLLAANSILVVHIVIVSIICAFLFHFANFARVHPAWTALLPVLILSYMIPILILLPFIKSILKKYVDFHKAQFGRFSKSLLAGTAIIFLASVLYLTYPMLFSFVFRAIFALTIGLTILYIYIGIFLMISHKKDLRRNKAQETMSTFSAFEKSKRLISLMFMASALISGVSLFFDDRILFLSAVPIIVIPLAMSLNHILKIINRK